MSFGQVKKKIINYSTIFKCFIYDCLYILCSFLLISSIKLTFPFALQAYIFAFMPD